MRSVKRKCIGSDLEFKIPKVKHKYPLFDGEIECYRIKDKPLPVDWAVKNWKLTNIYAQKGRFIPHKWQEFLINLMAFTNTIMTVAPVRSGKTMIDNIKWGYCIDNYDMGGMVVFPNEKVVKKNFKLRMIPAIKNIPVLRKYWTTKDDDLTIENIILTNSVWGVASAWNKDDLASFGAQCVIADECSKWKKPSDFDPFRLLQGRQEDYKRVGEWKFFACSSPFEVGDLYYKEIYKQGNLIITPHAKCPYCQELFEWSDYDIKENTSRDSSRRKNPEHIRKLKEAAVRYECPHCKQEITEDMRFKMVEETAWCAPKIEQRDFKQEFAVVNDGTTAEPLIDLSQYTAICPNWNKLIEPTYKFYQCLADFFDSLSSPLKHKAYENEIMARFLKSETKKKSKDFFLQRRMEYCQYGDESYVPDGVLVVTCAFDTQDTGLYYTIRGWGKNMETWLLRHDFIDLPFDNKSGNKAEAFEILMSHFRKPLVKQDGSKMRIHFGLIDRGGHMASYIDYFCDHIQWLNPYVGNPRIDYKQPIIEKRSGKSWLYGQTELLSEKVEARIGKPNWHLPADVTDTYLAQLTAQFWVSECDDFGQVKRKMIKLPEDHLRDCENYQEGIVEFLGLEDKLFSSADVELIEKFNHASPNQPEPIEENITNNNYQPQTSRWLSALRRRIR